MTYILVYNKKKNLKQASQRNDKQYKCWDFELRKFPPPPFSSLWRGHQYILTGEHFITEVQLLLIIPYIIQPHSHYFQFPTRPLSSLAHLSVSVCMSTCLCRSIFLSVCLSWHSTVTIRPWAASRGQFFLSVHSPEGITILNAWTHSLGIQLSWETQKIKKHSETQPSYSYMPIEINSKV